MSKFPRQFWREEHLPPTIWTKCVTPDNKKDGVAILTPHRNAVQLNCATVLSMNMVDPNTLNPLSKKTGQPVDGMSLSQFEKYIKYLSADPNKSKVTWWEFKDGKREVDKVSWNTTRYGSR
jgi:hypothetical protein